MSAPLLLQTAAASPYRQLRPTAAGLSLAVSPHLPVPGQLSSASAPASAASASSSSSPRVTGLRILLCLLSAAAAFALLSIGLDHLAVIAPPLLVCLDPDSCTHPAEPLLSSPSAPPSAPAAASLPGHYDSASSLLSSPPLAGIFAANGIRVVPEGGGPPVLVDLTQPALRAAVDAHENGLRERLSSGRLAFHDWTNGSAQPPPQSMAAYYASLPAGADLVSRSSRNVNYTVSVWENVCLTYGGPKDPHLVFLGSDVSSQQTRIDSQLLTQPHNAPLSWLPPRYCNDQGRLRAQARAEADWLWLSGTSFHQLEWDFNIGHQFHQQVWPMYVGLAAHAAFAHPEPRLLLLEGGCADAASSLGVRHNAWKPINQLFARMALEAVRDRLRVLRQPCPSEGGAVSRTGVCFERLLLNDGKDQYLERGKPDSSFAAFRRFRALILDCLQLQLAPFPSPAASRPLRVTIYSRRDSDRRRIVNVDELQRALEPHHIVRHVHSFGVRPAAEQLSLYATTDLLIAPHGAHMTFAFLLPAQAVVVECFAHVEGKFSWTVNFLAATAHRHLQIVGIAVNDSSRPLSKEFRHMDRDFAVDLYQLCTQLRQLSIPIQYDC